MDSHELVHSASQNFGKALSARKLPLFTSFARITIAGVKNAPIITSHDDKLLRLFNHSLWKQ
jgi:hypothetical protein